MSAQPEVAPGQIWVQMDSRFERYVQVLAVNASHVSVVTVDSETFVKTKGTRKSFPLLIRFSGKSGGYAFHKSIETGEQP